MFRAILILWIVGSRALVSGFHRLHRWSNLANLGSTEAPSSSFEKLDGALRTCLVSDRNRIEIIDQLIDMGMAQESELLGISRAQDPDSNRDLVDILTKDFQVKKLHAHQLQAAMRTLVLRDAAENAQTEDTHIQTQPVQQAAVEAGPSEKSSFKEYRVKNQRRRAGVSGESETKKQNYGLRDDDISPKLRGQLEDFLMHMTENNPLSQEPPIRLSTAEVYLRHAKLFCGWWISVHADTVAAGKEVSLEDIFPTKEKKGAAALYTFIRWLKQERDISDSYEANFLRGISKLLKYRFAEESISDPSYGDKTYEDIPMVREARKLHRDANRRQKIAPRSSDEDKKWLSWPEYLAVVQRCREEVDAELTAYHALMREREGKGLSVEALPASLQGKQRKIAQQFQRYIVLALLATVPDRQRTFRELELGKTFYREEAGYVIKHGPDDYKTGSSYGDRPPLRVSTALTDHIDLFVGEWRQHLSPRGGHLFAQARTGKPFTSDTMYSIVARACFAWTGKKTNPHLLRDMIVTHVRGTDASEKELEALALFMGHSISMQRSSYDRRSLSQKVEPAANLLQKISQLE